MKIIVLVGTYRSITERQIKFLKERLPYLKTTYGENVEIFEFKLDKQSYYINDSFMSSLSEYDLMIMSGGETSDFILRKADFSYLYNLPGPFPLISYAIIYGGILEGKRIILKGGLIGNDAIYLSIVEWIHNHG